MTRRDIPRRDRRISRSNVGTCESLTKREDRLELKSTSRRHPRTSAGDWVGPQDHGGKRLKKGTRKHPRCREDRPPRFAPPPRKPFSSYRRYSCSRKFRSAIQREAASNYLDRL